MLSTWFSYVDVLSSTNPYVNGLLAALMNTGVAHLSHELSPVSQRIYSSPWVRRLLILIMFFSGTRNFKISIVLTIVTIILVDVLLNANHPFTMLTPSTTMSGHEVGYEGMQGHVNHPTRPPPPPPHSSTPARETIRENSRFGRFIDNHHHY